MTPAEVEEIRAAADALDGTTITVTSYDENGHVFEEREPDALSDALAVWLRHIADDHDDTACPAFDGALPVARRINGRNR